MEIPGLGPVTESDYETLVSAPVPVPLFGNAPVPFALDGYEDDDAPEDFHAAIRTFLSLDRTTLTAAAPQAFAYYREIFEAFGEGLDDFPLIEEPEDVWDHVTFDRHEVTVQRNGEGTPVYISVECECTWEEEHGLQLVLREGKSVTRVGPYDGHLTDDL
ncbi:DUF6985 domain-containing protein [Lentzea sp. NPDC059081]|uniref:DUF6985 domain-containing protein n=1 Tax=Lentzea sp. NPDC059081 TaxID=3346719 RepID=UPI0036BF8ABC